MLREPLGSEIVAHFTVAAPPALTEDVRELARDVGQESAVRTAVAEGENETVMVGRFGPRSRITNGETSTSRSRRERCTSSTWRQA